MTDDYEDFDVIIAPAAEQLKSIEELATEAHRLMKIVDELEASLKVNKAELMNLTHKAIPDAMAAAGTSSFKTVGGVKVEIKDVMHGTLPKDDAKRAIALRWVEDHGGKSIIKSELVCEFEKGGGNLEKKNRAAEVLSDMGVAFSDRESIHPQTLCAFAREKLKAGEEVPTELLGLYAGRVAKVEAK
jgi:hypothetical protein